MATIKLMDLPEQVIYNEVIAEHCFYVDFDKEGHPLSRVTMPDLIVQLDQENRRLKAEREALENVVNSLNLTAKQKVHSLYTLMNYNFKENESNSKN